jgi:type I restriction enzyme S subunit
LKCVSPEYLIVASNETIANKYGSIANSLMAKIKVNSIQSGTLATIRDKLLPKLLSGEIRVKNVEQQIAEVKSCY